MSFVIFQLKSFRTETAPTCKDLLMFRSDVPIRCSDPLFLSVPMFRSNVPMFRTDVPFCSDVPFLVPMFLSVPMFRTDVPLCPDVPFQCFVPFRCCEVLSLGPDSVIPLWTSLSTLVMFGASPLMSVVWHTK